MEESAQQAAEQAVTAAPLITASPEFYTQGWLLYVLLAAAFLVIAHLLMRNWKVWIRIPIWALCAAGALTPAVSVSVSGQAFYAPAIIVAIFGLEKAGIAGAIPGLLPIVLVFLLLLVVLTAVQIIAQRRAKATPPIAAKSETSDDENAEPVHIEPKL